MAILYSQPFVLTWPICFVTLYRRPKTIPAFKAIFRTDGSVIRAHRQLR